MRMVNKMVVLAPKEVAVLKNGMRIKAGKVEVAVPVLRTADLQQKEDKGNA